MLVAHSQLIRKHVLFDAILTPQQYACGHRAQFSMLNVEVQFLFLARQTIPNNLLMKIIWCNGQPEPVQILSGVWWQDRLTFLFPSFFFSLGEWKTFVIFAFHLTESTGVSIVWSMIDFLNFRSHNHVAIAPSACFLLLGITVWRKCSSNDFKLFIIIVSSEKWFEFYWQFFRRQVHFKYVQYTERTIFGSN